MKDVMHKLQNPLYAAYMRDHHGIKLPDNVQIKAAWNKSGNIKLGGSMWSFSTMYGNHEIEVRKGNMIFVMKGTCGKHCKGCEGSCYVPKSYRYPSVIWSHARNTIAIRADIEQAERDLIGQIDRARNKPEVCRFDQSGEIESLAEARMFEHIAASHPEITFYCYTKCYDVIIPELLAGNVPDNLIILISIWHQYGIKEYLKVAHLPNVKAFVLVDNDWTAERYAKHGIIIETMCGAYDRKGKMDHRVTCMACGKCFRGAVKVIGCYEH